MTTPSSDSLEQWLCELLAERLKAAPGSIRPTSDLSLLAIDSLMVTSATSDLSERVGRAIDPAALYEHRTVRSLVESISGSAAHDVGTASSRPSDEERQPLAIVGVSCRVPGASDPAELWDLLRSPPRPIAVAPPSPSRATGDHKGYFLDDIDRFDNEYFAIPATEACQMDPQHRVLLELTQEAFDDALRPAPRSEEERVGVFVSTGAAEYAARFHRGSFGPADSRTAIGLARASAANRISYNFDFRGPSVVVDSACSSSLVAMMSAARSLWAGECEMAVVGGANLLVEPIGWESLTAMDVLSPTGACRPFSRDANGYVRGEGAGVLLLEPLDRAVANGRVVYATVVGGATNHNGRSNGFSAPQPSAQRELLQLAYQDAGVDPTSVTFIEAHGTGTRLGDLCEASALAETLGSSERAAPCYVGSIKSSVGHLEAAAGVLGVIRAALSLHRREVAVASPSPSEPAELGLAEAGLVVPGAGVQLAGETPIYAGVSSFGFGGTNAHVVLESYDAQTPNGSVQKRKAGPVMAVPLSARSAGALAELRSSYANALRVDPTKAHAIASGAALNRSHVHPHRFGVVGTSADQLAMALDGSRAHARSLENPRIVLVLPGQGGRWRLDVDAVDLSMPAFGDSLEECDDVFESHIGRSLSDEIQRGTHSDAGLILAQSAHFAVQYALGKAWLAFGVKPAGYIGHSIGEVAAACLAGALSLADGARVVVERARSVESHAPPGHLVHLTLAPDDAMAWATERGHSAVSVAAVNSASSCVLAIPGASDGFFDDDEVGRPRLLDAAGYPAHSVHMSDAAELLQTTLGELDARDFDPIMVSTVTGRAVSGTDLGSDYWAQNLKRPVQFAEAVGYMTALGPDVYLEVGPRSSLTPALQSILADRNRSLPTVRSLRNDDDAPLALWRAAMELFEVGLDPNWVAAVRSDENVSLPSQPWAKTSHWIDDVHPSSGGSGSETSAVMGDAGSAMSGSADPDLSDLLVTLLNAEQTEYEELLGRAVVGLIAQELLVGPEEIDMSLSPVALGLNSIGTSFVLNQLRLDLGIEVPVSEVLGEASLRDVVAVVARSMLADTDHLELRAMAEDLLAMSDAEVAEALILEADEPNQ